MKCLEPDPYGYGPDDIIERLNRCIGSGIYGIDYTIDARAENEEFFQKYIISERDRIDILLKLKTGDYKGWEPSNNPKYSKDIVYFFDYTCSLIPRGIEDAKSEIVAIYIKITWPKHLNGVLWVISFHD